MNWLFTFGRKDILRLANKYVFGVKLIWALFHEVFFYIFHNSVPSFFKWNYEALTIWYFNRKQYAKIPVTQLKQDLVPSHWVCYLLNLN